MQSTTLTFDNTMLLPNETSCRLNHELLESRSSYTEEAWQCYLHNILFIKPGKDGITRDGGAVWCNKLVEQRVGQRLG